MITKKLELSRVFYNVARLGPRVERMSLSWIVCKTNIPSSIVWSSRWSFSSNVFSISTKRVVRHGQKLERSGAGRVGSEKKAWGREKSRSSESCRQLRYAINRKNNGTKESARGKRTDLVGYVGWHGNFFLLGTVHVDDASSVTIPRRVYSRGECQIVTRNFAIATGLPLAPVPSRASRKLC